MTSAQTVGGKLRRILNKSGDSLRSYVAAPAVLPRALVVLLFAWPVLLFAFFIVPETPYRNVPTLFKSSSAGDSSATGEQQKPLALLALPMEGNSDLNDERRVRLRRQIRERAATNTLLVSGYLSDAHSSGIQYTLTPSWDAVKCATIEVKFPGDPSQPEINEATYEWAMRLALAIVAAEKFNRNATHRFAERTYAKLHRWAFGQLPDLSFGPAQVRLSLLRRLAAHQQDWSTMASWSSLSDDELLDMLWRECDALKTVATIVLWQLNVVRDCGHVNDDGAHGCHSAESVAALYSGQRRLTFAPITYAGIVDAMVNMLALPPGARVAALGERRQDKQARVTGLADSHVAKSLDVQELRVLEQVIYQAFTGEIDIPASGSATREAQSPAMLTAKAFEEWKASEGAVCRSLRITAVKRVVESATIKLCQSPGSEDLYPAPAQPEPK